MKDTNAILEAIKTERLSSYEGKDTYEIGFLDGLARAEDIIIAAKEEGVAENATTTEEAANG